MTRRRETWRGTRRDETGAGMVEAALVVPTLFFFLCALLDLGMGVFQSSQASAAARDGARAAILDYVRADQSGTPDAEKIQAAVAAHLPGQQFTLSVRCLSTDTGTTTPCQSADPDEDRVEVEVRWPRRYYTFVGPMFDRTTSVEGTSAMALVGRPVDQGGEA